ncbi:PPC domain-containing DNA-binding protein [Dyadobacter psychrotolerans]|uniref:DNA-binding protein n=1 Tax=Dyadobacter psychrotolerans TaxID=2541721 RepID=A0A4R5DT16_9BACT|nr:PPC domain-containing DNA-binding protein [Dyadobacter psychrotolerans]TDE15410.1 DNA-binding protein [Dyadobacter psychrotolerans]
MSIIKTVAAVVFTVIFGSDIFSQTPNKADKKRYTKVPAGYLMVLRQGDNILKELETFAEMEKIPAANFTGMGFVNMRFGFFNFETKEYDPKEFEGVELASMQGTIAWQKGKVSIHAHGVVTDKNFNAFGGHILSGSVGTGSVEIMLTIHDKKLERNFEDEIGANVLSLQPQN